MEIKQAKKKAKEIPSKCSPAFKTETIILKLKQGIKKKIQQKEY